MRGVDRLEEPYAEGGRAFGLYREDDIVRVYRICDMRSGE